MPFDTNKIPSILVTAADIYSYLTNKAFAPGVWAMHASMGAANGRLVVVSTEKTGTIMVLSAHCGRTMAQRAGVALFDAAKHHVEEVNEALAGGEGHRCEEGCPFLRDEGVELHDDEGAIFG